MNYDTDRGRRGGRRGWGERHTTDWHWQWGGFPQVAEQVEKRAVRAGSVAVGGLILMDSVLVSRVPLAAESVNNSRGTLDHFSTDRRGHQTTKQAIIV